MRPRSVSSKRGISRSGSNSQQQRMMPIRSEDADPRLVIKPANPHEKKAVAQRLHQMKKGKICLLLPKPEFGHIIPDDAPAAAEERIYFKLVKVKNISSKAITLEKQMSVHYELGEGNNKNPSEGNKQHPPAKAVIVGDSRLSAPAQKWLKGTVCEFRGGDPSEHVFLSCQGQSKDVFLHTDKLSTYALDVKPGDTIEFVLNHKGDSKKPSAMKARYCSFVPRSSEELEDYLAELEDIMDSPNAYMAALELVPIACLWTYLGNAGIKIRSQAAYGHSLVQIVSRFLKHCNTQPNMACLLYTSPSPRD